MVFTTEMDSWIRGYESLYFSFFNIYFPLFLQYRYLFLVAFSFVGYFALCVSRMRAILRVENFRIIVLVGRKRHRTIIMENDACYLNMGRKRHRSIRLLIRATIGKYGKTMHPS
jgi:hypothetical protein